STELPAAQERLNQLAPADLRRPEAIEARAVQDLLVGKLGEARVLLMPLGAEAAARKDPLVPVYQGWVELRDGKLPAAEQAFRDSLPAHFGASLGQIRTSYDPNSDAILRDVVGKSKDSAGPREPGDAWTTL